MSSEWSPPTDWNSRPICVIGGDVLGRIIAACFVAVGYYVRIQDPSAESRTEALEYLRTELSQYTTLTHRQEGTYEAVEDFVAGFKDSWLVFEAVPEILSLKEDVFVKLEKYAPTDSILATDSSSYKSSELTTKTSFDTRARVLNTNFMMPPQALIVELMTSGCTHSRIFPFLTERYREVGLHPIVASKESTEYVFNRVWAAIKREVLAVLAEGGSTPEMIDSVWIEQYCNQKLGPCMMMDSVGLDTVNHIEQHYIQERKLPSSHAEWLSKNFLDQGKLGLKTTRQGGLYSPPAPESLTKLLVLNLELAEPLTGKTPKQVVHSGQILSFTAKQPTRPVELVGRLYVPDGIDIAESNGRMYWTQMGNPMNNDGLIYSARLDGSDIREVVKTGQIHTPKQMVIDQVDNKIFVSDREGLRVVRCNLDGTQLEVLYQYYCVAEIEQDFLDSERWFQGWGGSCFSAGIDIPADKTPSNRSDVDVVISSLPGCIDLEIDDEEGILYWTDRGELPLGNTLSKKHPIGETRPEEKALGRQIIAQGLGEGIGLRLDKEQNCLYVADMSGHVWRCSTEYDPKEKLLEGPNHAYSGVAFYKL